MTKATIRPEITAQARILLMPLFAASLIFAVSPAKPAPAPTASVEEGRLQGVVDGQTSGVRIFRGIPFAAPPVGVLRWVETQPAAKWRGTRDATKFAPRCMQRPLFSDMQFRSPGISEDCLYLNVWLPRRQARSPNRGFPVLLYFYGGGFDAGDSSEKRYDGASLSRRGIVVVTANYRLDVFGWLAHPELTLTSAHHSSGNYGLLDQIAALKWVRRNIAAFEGDPKHITIAGESAGSMSVSALMASPLSRRLIAGAIGESGALMQKWSPSSRDTAERQGVAFATSIGASTLSQLRATPADALLAARNKAANISTGVIIDGYALTEAPSVTFEYRRAAHVPLLVGSNSQEAAASAVIGDGPPTLTNYRAGLAKTLGDKADAVFDLYPALSDDDVISAATSLASDDFLALPTWKWFDLQRQTGAPTYLYQFSRVRPPSVTDASTRSKEWGAVHSAEIEYALGNLDVNPLYRWNSVDREISNTMTQYWANFVKTGNPNGRGVSVWPRASINPLKIRRQIIDVRSKSVPFVEQKRYEKGERLVYMH
jgi:para-nitrobenzyl esterase